MIDPLFTLSITWGLAILFALAGLHKLTAQVATREAITAYQLLPIRLVDTAATVLPLAELLVAICLLLPSSRRLALAVATVFLTVYATAIAINLFRGNLSLDCGCSFGSTQQTVSWGLVHRNLVLALLAIAATFPSTARNYGAADFASCAFAVVVSGVLYMTVNNLLANARYNRSSFHE